MIKTLIAIPTLTAFYNYPTYALLIAIGLVFAIDLISRLSKKEAVLESHYSQTKEIYLEEESQDVNYREPVLIETTSTLEIKCAPLDFSSWKYSDLNTMARLHSLKPKNRKKLTLISELLSIC